MLYKYYAKKKDGQPTSGTIESSSQSEVTKLLRQKEYFVVDIKEAGHGFEIKNLKLSFSFISFNDIVNLTRQLSTMITAGLPLVQSLTILSQQKTKTSFSNMLKKILKKIESGESLSKALSEHPRQFNKIFTSTVRSGETSGKLDNVLERLADNLEKDRDFRGKIKGAMIYPVVILIGMFAMIFLMMTLVVPKLTEFFENFTMELPLPTKILIFTAKIFSNFWWLILISIIGLFFAFSSWSRTEGGKAILDKIQFKLPLLGAMRREMILTEMTRTLSLLVESGVPILEGLQIISEAVESPSYSAGIKAATVKVEKGYPLGVSFSDNPVFPSLLSQMITVGEETGKMDETLFRVSKFYEASAEEKVKILTTAIEPIIIVVLGVVVAFVVLSIVLPMYQVTQAV